MKDNMFGIQKVFNKQRFIEAEGVHAYLQGQVWIDDADGMPVADDGECRGKRGARYKVLDAWCSYLPVFRGADLNCKCVVQKGKKSTPAPRYRIVIECDGDTTTAEMQVNGRKVKQAQAKRNPADEFNWRIGAETAFVRLFEKKDAKQEERPFRVGDRVVCVKPTDGRKVAVGKHGRVILVRPDWDKEGHGVSVEFDENIGGHDCGGNGKWGYCWNCSKESLRHE